MSERIAIALVWVLERAQFTGQARLERAKEERAISHCNGKRKRLDWNVLVSSYE